MNINEAIEILYTRLPIYDPAYRPPSEPHGLMCEVTLRVGTSTHQCQVRHIAAWKLAHALEAGVFVLPRGEMRIDGIEVARFGRDLDETGTQVHRRIPLTTP